MNAVLTFVKKQTYGVVWTYITLYLKKSEVTEVGCGLINFGNIASM